MTLKVKLNFYLPIFLIIFLCLYFENYLNKNTIILEDNKYLFVNDRLLIKKNNNIYVNQPKVRKKNIISSSYPQKNFQPWVSIKKKENQFFLFYNSLNNLGNLSELTNLNYDISNDGLNFTRVKFETNGIDPHLTYGNRIFEIDHPNLFGGSKYIMLFYTHRKASKIKKGGFYIATSDDLVNWKINNNPIIQTEVNDIIDIYRIEGDQNFYLTVKAKQKHEWFDKKNINHDEEIRLVKLIKTKDFKNFVEIGIIFKPDNKDDGITQFYGTCCIKKIGDLYVGFLKVIRDDLIIEKNNENIQGIGYTELIYSENGLDWKRFREPNIFLKRSFDSQANDYSHAMIDSSIEVDEEIFLYYGAYNKGHKGDKSKSRNINVASIIKDRFAYLAIIANEKVKTKLLKKNKINKIILNAEIQNYENIEIEFLNIFGKPFRNFDNKKCKLLKVLDYKFEIKCGNKFSIIENSLFQISIRSQKYTKLYAIEFL